MTISRRTLTKAAWTTPVLAACAPVPAFATSTFTCTVIPCKTQNKKDGNRWDFKVYLGCSNGTAATVLINGKVAKRTYDAKGREFWVLERQPHSYTAQLKVLDRFGSVGLERQITFGSCPA